jgi:hypothetical protein
VFDLLSSIYNSTTGQAACNGFSVQRLGFSSVQVVDY